MSRAERLASAHEQHAVSVLMIIFDKARGGGEPLAYKYVEHGDNQIYVTYPDSTTPPGILTVTYTPHNPSHHVKGSHGDHPH
jgi:hypothetical protein